MITCGRIREMCAERKGDSLPVKAFEELEVGDPITGLVLLGWNYFSNVPEVVAQTWFTQLFPATIISSKGVTSSEAPIKDWEVGWGVVVEAPIAFPGKERLVLLHRSGPENYRLYVSTDTRTTKP